MRWLGLLSAGAIGVHELRYLAAPGAHAHDVFSAQAHSYLPLACALVLLLFIASAAQFVSSLVVARSGEVPPPQPLRFRTAWTWATVRAARNLRHSGVAGRCAFRGPHGWTARPLRSWWLVGLRIRAPARRSGGVSLAWCAEGDRARRSCRHQALSPQAGPQDPDAAAGQRGDRLRPLARHIAGRAPPVTAS